MEVAYEDGYVRVTSDENQTVQLAVYTSVGQQTLTAQLRLQAGEAKTYVGNLPSGVYVAVVTGANGEAVSCKFIIK